MNNTVLEFECIGMDGGNKFPIEYTGRGQDISPEFIIKNLSPNAKTLAVTLEDLSHPIKCNAALYSRRKQHFIFDRINTIAAVFFR